MNVKMLGTALAGIALLVLVVAVAGAACETYEDSKLLITGSIFYCGGSGPWCQECNGSGETCVGDIYGVNCYQWGGPGPWVY